MIDNPFIKTLTVILLIVGLLAGSCAPKTKTITPLSEADRTRIKKVAIHVQVNDELNADISKLKMEGPGGMGTCTGDPAACLLFIPVFLIAVIIEQSIEGAIRSHIDNKKAEEFREDISDIKMDKLISERIDEYFETTNAPFEAEISELQSPSILAQQGFDTILDITIEELNVKLCPHRQGEFGYSHGVGPPQSYSYRKVLYSADATRVSKEEVEMLRPVVQEYASDSVRVWITFKGKIISTRDGRVLWDREELYYDPKCERVQDMQSSPEIVVDMLTRSIHGIAVSTVNQIQ